MAGCVRKSVAMLHFLIDYLVNRAPQDDQLCLDSDHNSQDRDFEVTEGYILGEIAGRLGAEIRRRVIFLN